MSSLDIDNTDTGIGVASTAASAPRQAARTWCGTTALRVAALLWFAVTALGQWTFVVYIVAFYGGAVVRGDTARWGTFLTHGLIPGDRLGNVALATHLALAAVITAGGPLQLVPQIRARAPRFHRWSGRTYLVTALLMSVTALYLNWIRNSPVPAGAWLQHLGVTLNALLILVCGTLALRHALARRFAAHRRWALRLFLVVSGVWFFRVGVFFNLLVNQGPFGFNPDTFQGPFLDILSFAESLVPLAILELYLRAQARGSAFQKIAMATGLAALTVAVAVGILGVLLLAWLPSIRPA